MVGHAKRRRIPTKSSVVEVLEVVRGDLDGIRQFGYGVVFVLRKFVDTSLQGLHNFVYETLVQRRFLPGMRSEL